MRTPHVIALLALPILCGVLSLPGPSWARERVVVVAELEVGEQAVAPEGLEALLGDALLGVGVPLLESDAAARLRVSLSTGRALEGKLPAGLAALEAEWVLAARAECESRQEKGVMHKVQARTGSADVIFSANCTAALTLVRSDTSEVAGKASLSGAGAAAYGHEAVRRALKRIVAELEGEKLEAWARRMKAPRPVLLWAFGLPGKKAESLLLDALASIEGVRGRQVLRRAEGLLKIELETDPRGTALAASLEAKGLAISIEQASGKALTLRWDPAAALETKLFFRTFSDATGDPRLAVRVKVAAGRLAAFLSGESWVALAERPEEASLLVEGRMRRSKRGALVLRVAVKDSKGRDVLALSSSDVDPEASVARSLGKRLPGAIARFARRRRDAAWARVFRGGASKLANARAPTALSVVGSDIDGLFSAQAGHYLDAPLGELRLRVRGDQALEVVATTEVIGLSGGGRLSPAVMLRAGEEGRVPVFVGLDEAKLEALGTARGGQLQVELAYRPAREPEAERSLRVVLPLRIHERRAIDWRDRESAAAFVTPRDPVVQAVVREALRAEDPRGVNRLTPELARGVRVVSVLAAQGLEYQPDPVLSFGKQEVDYVRLPAETLADGGGDCDDLAVLVAASLEAAGVAARLVETPGHLLVAFDSGLPAAFAARAGLSPGGLLSVGGRGWVPVEATALAEGFWPAVEKGGVAIRGASVRSFALRPAWRAYPPMSAGTGRHAQPIATADPAAALSSLLERRKAALGALAALDEGEQDAITRARALASRGEIQKALGLLPPDEVQRVGGDEASTLRANLLAVSGDLEGAAALLAQPSKGEGPLAIGRTQNLALVKWLAGDTPAAAGLLEALLLSGAELPPWAEGGLVRGADQGEAPAVMQADLAALVARVRARALARIAKTQGDRVIRGRARSDENARDDDGAVNQPFISGGRRGADPEARKALALLLYWP